MLRWKLLFFFLGVRAEFGSFGGDTNAAAGREGFCFLAHDSWSSTSRKLRSSQQSANEHATVTGNRCEALLWLVVVLLPNTTKTRTVVVILVAKQEHFAVRVGHGFTCARWNSSLSSSFVPRVPCLVMYFLTTTNIPTLAYRILSIYVTSPTAVLQRSLSSYRFLRNHTYDAHYGSRTRPRPK